MGMNINLDDEQIKNLVSEAIFTSLTEESRNNLIKEALKYLVEPDSNVYHKDKKSPLQRIFNSSIERYARIEINKWFDESDERKEQIRNIFVTAWEKFIQGYNEDGGVSEKIAHSFAEALIKDRY